MTACQTPRSARVERPARNFLTWNSGRPRASLIAPLLFSGAFLLALLPRLIGSEVFVTTDESLWLNRAGNFARALTSGLPRATFQTGHPGVTTMWIGLAGMGPATAQRIGTGQATVLRSQVAERPGFLVALFAARRMMAMVTALAAAALALLAWRLFGLGAALASVALLAFDPFLVAFSQLLHNDPLVASFMALALVAGLVRWGTGGSRTYLVLSGVAGGLALVTKLTGLQLLVAVPLLALVAARWRDELRWRALGLDLLTWAGLALLTALLVWPALWSAPGEVLRGEVAFVLNNGNPLRATTVSGTFDYRLSRNLQNLFQRTTPLLWLGLGWLTWEWAERLRAARSGHPSRESISRSHRLAALALVGYVGLFILGLSLAPRLGLGYLLPVEPPLVLLAGSGLARAGRRLARLPLAIRALSGLAAVVLLLQPWLFGAPYLLDWSNPLVGGVSTERRQAGGGFGQGLDLVAAYLNAQPNPERLIVAMPGDIVPASLDALFDGRVLTAETEQPWSRGLAYFVTYGRRMQELGPPFYDPRYQTWPPVERIERGGIAYAQIYDARRGVPVGASFGGQVELQGYGLEQLISTPGGPLRTRLFWRGLAGSGPGTRAVLTLTDPGGRELISGRVPLETIGAGQETVGSYELMLPPQIASDEILLWVGLQAANGELLALDQRPAALAPGAPELPNLAVLRSIAVQAARRQG